jgi:hypothetical protein
MTGSGEIVGVNLRGTLRRPELSVFSNPSMSESEIMSYLMFGRPMSSGSGEQSALANAASLIAMQQGSEVAGGLGKRFALDDAYLESGSEAKETSFVAGKYLSPKLYVSYAAGLFEQTNTFRVRYSLSNSWTLQAESGKDSSTDILYRFERGQAPPGGCRLFLRFVIYPLPRPMTVDSRPASERGRKTPPMLSPRGGPRRCVSLCFRCFSFSSPVCFRFRPSQPFARLEPGFGGAAIDRCDWRPPMSAGDMGPVHASSTSRATTCEPALGDVNTQMIKAIAIDDLDNIPWRGCSAAVRFRWRTAHECCRLRRFVAKFDAPGTTTGA